MEFTRTEDEATITSRDSRMVMMIKIEEGKQEKKKKERRKEKKERKGAHPSGPISLDFYGHTLGLHAYHARDE